MHSTKSKRKTKKKRVCEIRTHNRVIVDGEEVFNVIIVNNNKTSCNSILVDEHNVFEDILRKCITEETFQRQSEFAELYLKEKRENLQTLLSNGSLSYKDKHYKIALAQFDAALEIIDRDCYPDEFNLSSVDMIAIKYAMTLCNFSIKEHGSLQTAVMQLTNMIIDQGWGCSYPFLYLSLAKCHFALKQYEICQRIVQEGLQKVKIKYLALKWPGTNLIIEDTEPGKLKDKLELLVKLCNTSENSTPDAQCYYTNCLTLNNQKNIYFQSPAFTGYTLMTCTKKCRFCYHPNCWKKFLKVTGSFDQLLGSVCNTDGCAGILHNIEIFDETKKLKTSKTTPKDNVKPIPLKENKSTLKEPDKKSGENKENIQANEKIQKQKISKEKNIKVTTMGNSNATVIKDSQENNIDEKSEITTKTEETKNLDQNSIKNNSDDNSMQNSDVANNSDFVQDSINTNLKLEELIPENDTNTTFQDSINTNLKLEELIPENDTNTTFQDSINTNLKFEKLIPENNINTTSQDCTNPNFKLEELFQDCINTNLKLEEQIPENNISTTSQNSTNTNLKLEELIPENDTNTNFQDSINTNLKLEELIPENGTNITLQDSIKVPEPDIVETENKLENSEENKVIFIKGEDGEAFLNKYFESYRRKSCGETYGTNDVKGEITDVQTVKISDNFVQCVPEVCDKIVQTKRYKTLRELALTDSVAMLTQKLFEAEDAYNTLLMEKTCQSCAIKSSQPSNENLQELTLQVENLKKEVNQKDEEIANLKKYTQVTESKIVKLNNELIQEKDKSKAGKEKYENQVSDISRRVLNLEQANTLLLDRETKLQKHNQKMFNLLLQQMRESEMVYNHFLLGLKSKCNRIIWEMKDLATVVTYKTIPTLTEISTSEDNWQKTLMHVDNYHCYILDYYRNLLIKLTSPNAINEELPARPKLELPNEPTHISSQYFKPVLQRNTLLEKQSDEQNEAWLRQMVQQNTETHQNNFPKEDYEEQALGYTYVGPMRVRTESRSSSESGKVSAPTKVYEPVEIPKEPDVKGPQGAMSYLQKHYPNTPVQYIQDALLELKQKRGKLSGMPLKHIKLEIDKILNSKYCTNHSNENQTDMKSPWAKVSNSLEWNKNQAEKNCSICFEYMDPSQLFQINCGHKFHKQCIKTWLKTNSVCPICRMYTKLDEEYPPLN